VVWTQHEANSEWDPEGRLAIRSVISDLTERRQAQALSAATEGVLAKGQMAAYIAHEINNPLMGIRNAFLLLARDIPPTHPYYNYVALIHQEIARIGNIVKIAYELHKPTNQAPSSVLIQAVLADITILLAPKARAHQVDLTLDLPDPQVCATLSSDLLRQILFNLLQNAVEASPPGSTVTCRAWCRRNRLCIQVIDTGPGIAPDLVDRVFEPGFSTKQLTGAQMGLGIGLGSSRQLAKGMGGKLSFENHRDDTGCTFTLDLPLGGPI
jgi:signal transduction histidine kinase